MKAKVSAELLNFNPSFRQEEMDLRLDLFQEKTL
jgi:hypothetical protein